MKDKESKGKKRKRKGERKNRRDNIKKIYRI
jgi:hypothetical protein